MKKILITGVIAIILLSFTWVLLVNYCIAPAINQAYKEYKQPDTTIIIKNGKADTTITINK